MRLVACIYIDHQDVMKYPIEYVLGTLDWVDAIYLYGSGEQDTAFFEKLKNTHPIGDKFVVKNMHLRLNDDPNVWPYATNRMIELTLVADPCDFLLVAGGDTLATELSISACVNFCARGNLDEAFHLHTEDASLYMKRGGGDGHSIIGRHFPGRIGINRNFHLGHREKVLHCLHIGYLSLELCANHLRQASRTWKSDQAKEIVRIYDSGDKKTFIRRVLDMRVPKPFQPIEDIDPRYTKVIDDLGLRDECNETVAFVRGLS